MCGLVKSIEARIYGLLDRDALEAVANALDTSETLRLNELSAQLNGG